MDGGGDGEEERRKDIKSSAEEGEEKFSAVNIDAKSTHRERAGDIFQGRMGVSEQGCGGR